MSKVLEIEEKLKSPNNNNFIAVNVSEYKKMQKELKALDIIVKHDVDLQLLKECFKFNMQIYDYNRHFKTLDKHYSLTQEEYDLLKEVLS